MNKIVRLLKQNLGNGIAPAVRYATSFSPNATVADMVAAGVSLGLNPLTVRKQFAQARKEDAAIEAACKGMTRAQFIEVVVRCNQS